MGNMGAKIWLFDEERETTESYAGALDEVGLDVRRFFAADTIVEAAERDPTPDGIVLDIMAPGGKTFSTRETKNGNRTGLRIYDRLRSGGYAKPVFFLTNLAEWMVREELPRGDESRVLEKIHYLPRNVAQIVKNAITPKPEFERCLRRFWDLQPGWYGPHSTVIGYLPVSRALEFLRPVVGRQCEEPHVFPTPAGGVQCEWHAEDGRKLILEWDRDGIVTWWCGSRAHVEGEGLRSAHGFEFEAIRSDLSSVGALRPCGRTEE